MLKWCIFINMTHELVWKTSKNKIVRKIIQRRVLLVALDYLLKNLVKKVLDYGLAPRIAYFFLEAQEEFFKGVSKEYFSKNIKKFQMKTSAVDCTFTVNLQVKPTTLLKLYLKTVFPEIFSEFLKKLLYFQISSPITEAYFKPNKKSMWELFGENSYA